MTDATKNSQMKIAIFVGGTGTRMWPMSRSAYPKQFQALVGEKTMFQQMIGHLLSGFSPDDVFISTSKKYVETIIEQAPMLNPDHIITEPELRDTTAAVGYAAVHIAHRFPGSMMATIWGGDHLVRQRGAFIEALHLAHKLALEKDLTVQINVRPTFPSTALGYIEVGERTYAEYGKNIFSYIRQVEKPDATTAKSFMRSVNYLWHSGYRVWSIQTLLELYKKHVPEAHDALMVIKAALDTEHESQVVAEEYHKIIKKSIDYTIFEHISKEGQAVIAADLGWNDIGTWQVLKDELADKEADNVTQGLTLLMDTTNSLVYGSKNKLIAVVGLDDIVIVDTPDALLVVPKDRAGDVKKIVEQLKEQGLDQYL